MILDGSNGVTFNDASLQGAAASPYVLKNRIINGAMVIDQRNAGASVTVNDSDNLEFPVDRFAGIGTASAGVFTLQQSTTAPIGFVNSIIATVTTQSTPSGTETYQIQQNIEGLNVADLAWGTANAKTVTISFWVRSSLTGTFGGALRNNALDRSYPYSYTINAANTWEYKTVTITGDTTGTWLTTNGRGIRVGWSLGSGSSRLGTAGAWNGNNNTGATGQVNLIATNGATFYITGVQLEQNTSATPFERRLYGQELVNCQRYYYRRKSISATADYIAQLQAYSTSGAFGTILYLPVEMRATPTASLSSPTHISAANTTASTYNAFTGGGSMNRSSPYSLGTSDLSGSSGLAAGACTNIRFNTTSGYIEASAEL
jgi:hypothetical protein